MPTDVIWRALAAPTRRAIIDVLFEYDRTTQEIVDCFTTVGRCAIMKHLGVLARAGLVRSGRDGRVRYNMLRLAPLHRIHDEWLGAYARAFEQQEARRRGKGQGAHARGEPDGQRSRLVAGTRSPVSRRPVILVLT
ncbi:MAG TPA: helix-turn-helix transcriptional regulator [Gemmatimonadaceae bacterium]|nr:helix-turn-helix transcriptional regulator [Gemmatimonadaceae bacterium]